MAAGRVVKGVNFVGLRDAGDPVELACRYDAAGADELVFLDIAATHQGRETLVELVERTASQLFIPFTVGGGIRSLDGITALLRAGADALLEEDGESILSLARNQGAASSALVALMESAIAASGRPVPLPPPPPMARRTSSRKSKSR